MFGISGGGGGGGGGVHPLSYMSVKKGANICISVFSCGSC